MSDRSYKFLNIASLIILGFGFAFFLMIIWLLAFEDNPPMEAIETPMRVDKAEYYPGDDMLITAHLCRYTDAGATIYVSFINLDNGLLYDIAPSYVDNLEQGCTITTRRVMIPNHLEPGRYIRRIRAQYDINILKNRAVDLETEEFMILAAKEES